MICLLEHSHSITKHDVISICTSKKAYPWTVLDNIVTFRLSQYTALRTVRLSTSALRIQTCSPAQHSLLYIHPSAITYANPTLTSSQARALPRAPRTFTPATIASSRLLTAQQIRSLSNEVRSAIDKAVAAAPVVLFMKGTPETPQCGYSRASVQILGMQGVDPAKFVAFNVLEDQELRQGMWCKGGFPA